MTSFRALEYSAWTTVADGLRPLDTLVFTAGIGENAPLVRERIGAAAAWLGVGLDEKRNRRGEDVVGNPNSSVDVLVIPADEERAVAAEMSILRSLWNQDGPGL